MASNLFVSRGGEKLQAAITNWKLKIENLVVLDVGSSTGGFVDCLLQNGASKVYSVDTAYGELAWTLRKNPKVVIMERTNILHLEDLPEEAESPEQSRTSISLSTTLSVNRMGRRVDLITIDASWTKLELILPVVRKFLEENGQIIALLKPHYQTTKENLVKGVVSEELVEQIKENTISKIENLGFKVEKVIESPILGGGGNQEYLLLLFPKK